MRGIMAAVGIVLVFISYASASASNESFCLQNAILPKQRKSVVVGGKSMPLGVWFGDWTSSLVSATVYKILLTDVVGYNATFSGSAASSMPGLYAVAGCQNPLEYSTSPDCKSRDSVSHLVFEVWEYPGTRAAFIQRINEEMKDTSEMMPEDLGTIGYDGTDGLFVKDAEKDVAWQSEGQSLEFYKSYDASWTQSSKYFDRLTAFDPIDLMPCSETRGTNTNEMDTYVRVTGDEAGVDSNGGQTIGRCWNGSWWLSPSCRARTARCVPVITGGDGWGMFDFQQKATKHNMPLAIAVATSTTAYQALARNARVLLYAFSPDSAFIDFAPETIIFPPYDKFMWENGDRTTMSKTTLLSKWAWNQLSTVASRAHALASRFSISGKMMDEMLLDQVSTGDSIADVACRWIRRNDHVWKPWIPGIAECVPGQGVVDKDGKFKTWKDKGKKEDEKKQEVFGCEWCSPGRYSFVNASVENSLFRCKKCPAGRFSQTTGATQCLPAPAGAYVATKGQADSQLCSIGEYAAQEGQSACKSCNERPFPEGDIKIQPLTTAFLGASNKSNCVCAPGTYIHEATCVLCADLPWFICQSNFGTKTPTIRPGYMSLHEEPLMVYLCSDEFACQGIRDPFATPSQPMCTNEFVGVACNRCRADYTSRGKGAACVPCEAQDQESGSSIFDALPVWVDLVYSFFLLLATCTWIFNMSMRPPTAERLIWGMIVGFLQTLTLTVGFPINFPTTFNIVLDIATIFDFSWKFIGVRSECFVGTSFTGRLLMKMGWPLLLQLAFLVVYLIWRTTHRILGGDVPPCLRPIRSMKRFIPKMALVHCETIAGHFWPMLSQNLLNCMQRSHLGLFITVLSTSFSLFDCKRHPNGRYTVKKFLDVECYSDEWWEAFPLGLSGVLVYCIGFASWIIYLIVLAPYRVGVDPYFARANRFIWAKWHPGRWWFTLAELTVAIFINMVAILGDNAYQQIYITTIIFVVYVMLLYDTKPWKFIESTKVDATMKLAVIVMLVLATAFVDISDDDRELTKNQFKEILFAVPILPLILAMFFLCQILWRKHYAKAVPHIERMLFAQRFRDVMAMACHMSNSEFNKLISVDLPDNDRIALVNATEVLIATVLKTQPGSGIWKRRIIPGKPYTVGTNESIDEGIIERGIHHLPALHERLLAHRIAEILKKLHKEEASAFNGTRLPMLTDLSKRIDSLRGKQSKRQRLMDILDMNHDGEISREEFQNALHFDTLKYLIPKEERLTDDELNTVFDMMDINGDGNVTIEELTGVIEVAHLSSKTLAGHLKDPNHKSPLNPVDAAIRIQKAFRAQKKAGRLKSQRNKEDSSASSLTSPACTPQEFAPPAELPVETDGKTRHPQSSAPSSRSSLLDMVFPCREGCVDTTSIKPQHTAPR